MTSDETTKPADKEFRFAGEGLSLHPLCFYCGKRKFREGGRMRGPLKNLFSCRHCEEDREHRKGN